jgi:hypothetical protein
MKGTVRKESDACCDRAALASDKGDAMKVMRLLPPLALLAVALVLPPGCSAARPLDKARAPGKKEIVDCRVSLDLNFTQFLEWRITDPKLVKKLIEDPLKNARPDPRPAKYVIIGSMHFKRKGGAEDAVALFRPWGRYKVEKKYRIADFSGIQEAFKKAIASADLTVASKPNPARPLDKGQAPEKKEIVECWISLDLGSSTGFLELRLTDPDLIKRLIEDPLRKAQPDPRPAKDKVLGSMIFRRKAGAEDRITLFEPWGRYAEEKKYMIADFSGIQKRFKKAIAHAKEFALLE